jgi:hypothetical protein
MADIEKGLPNIKTPLPGGAEEVTDVNIAEIQQKGPIEVTPEDDGGATVDFDPSANLNIPGTESHFDNLADILPDDVLDPIGSDLRFYYLDTENEDHYQSDLKHHQEGYLLNYRNEIRFLEYLNWRLDQNQRLLHHRLRV